jgi:hypothetical protein
MQTSKTLLAGGLYYTPPNWAKREDCQKALFGMKYVKSAEPLDDSHWYLLKFVSDKPLIDAKVETPPYVYPIYYRQSSRRALILSHRRHIAEEFLKIAGIFNRIPPLEAVFIDVQSLVALVCEKPGSYAITYLHARTTGLGSSIRSLSLYGDDVTGSSLYREHAVSLLAHTCGLRDVYADRRVTAEAIRLSADGSVSFYYGQREDLSAAEKALSFIYKGGFLLEPKGVGPRIAVTTADDIQQEPE